MIRRSRFLSNLTSGVLVALATGMVPMPGFPAGQPAAASAKSPAARNSRQQAQAYSGRIIRRDGTYVLVNSNDETTYQLDDQHKAKKYADKNVIVIGTLDLKNNIIHVSEIRRNDS